MASFIPSVQTFVKATVASAVGGATIGAGLLYYGQNYLIYPSGFPSGSRVNIPTPLDYNMIYQDVTLETPDNLRIKTYLLLQRRRSVDTEAPYPQEPILVPSRTSEHKREILVPDDMDILDQEVARSRPTVLIFHANAGNMGHRLPLARLFYERMNCNVLMLSYRGYGLSEGSPSEAGLRIDAQTSLDFVLDHPLLRSTKILLYGQSIGGAVSIDLASRNPRMIHGLILENTFLSIPLLIPSVLPILASVSFLCHQNWHSAESIKKIPSETPMLMLSGLMDEVVPPEHMRRLWEIATDSADTRNTKKSFERAHDEVEKDRREDVTQRRPSQAEDDGQKLQSKFRTETIGTRKWVEFKTGKHNDTCIMPEYWREVASFVKGFDKKE